MATNRQPVRLKNDRLGALVQHSFDAIALISPDGAVEYISPAVSRILGYPYGPRSCLSRRLTYHTRTAIPIKLNGSVAASIHHMD